MPVWLGVVQCKNLVMCKKHAAQYMQNDAPGR